MSGHRQADARRDAVYAIGLCVTRLTAAELLPTGLLTPMAADLRITEGLAGQTVTASALVALVTSLFTAVTPRAGWTAAACRCSHDCRSRPT